MPTEFEFTYRSELGKLRKIGNTGSRISLPLFLLFLVLSFILPSSKAETIFIIGSIIFLIMTITFLLFRLIYGSRMKCAGAFEEIFITRNAICYNSEKTGMKTFKAENIKSIRLMKRPKGNIYDIYIFLKNSGEIFEVPNTLTGNQILIKYIKLFAKEHGLP